MNNVRIFKKFEHFPWSRIAYGVIFLIFLTWLFITPPGLLGKADAIGYAVCHRIDVRSFHLGERQLPLCVRCTGMYLGALLGIVFQSCIGPKYGGTPSRGVSLFFAFIVFGFVVDGLNSYLNLLLGSNILYAPQNTLRLLTGTGMGLALSILLYPTFNQTVWKDWKSRPAIPGICSVVLLVILGALLDLVLLTENPLILYPLALASALGVVILLTMTYTMVLLMVFRSENRYNHLREMVLPLSGGFGICILQILLIDIVRYLITGTWHGFHLG
jgi:uncharacterized membrane protein